MSCTDTEGILTIYLTKKNVVPFTVTNKNVSTYNLYFKSKERVTDTTAPLLLVQATDVTFTTPDTTAIFTFDLTNSTLDAQIYEATIEITDGTYVNNVLTGSTFSDIVKTQIAISQCV